MIVFELIETLKARDLPPLYPTIPADSELSRRIAQASDEELFGSTNGDATMRDCCRAGLLLWNDDLDASHHISQRHEGDQTADCWHAIMHRREGDASNSGYWWRRVGNHPAFGDIYNATLNTLREENDSQKHDSVAALERAGSWQPVEFVRLCDTAQRQGNAAQIRVLQRVQAAEMEALLRWCLEQVGVAGG